MNAASPEFRISGHRFKRTVEPYDPVSGTSEMMVQAHPSERGPGMKITFAAQAALLLSTALFLGASDMNSSSPPSSPSLSAPDYDPAAEYQKGMEALKTHRFADAKKSFLKVYSD